MKLLLHTCCAPCSVQCINILSKESFETVAFWYNPNIHPYMEYKKRKQTMVSYAEDIGMKLIVQDEYGLRPFINGVISDLDNRCSFCYDIRLETTAKYAAENKFTCFTTTLLVSPYQKHDKIRHAAEQAAAKHGVEFMYRDFRPFFRTGQQQARDIGLYMQKYCGCIFSEEERYNNKPVNY